MGLPKPNEGNVISRSFKGKPEAASSDAARFAAQLGPEWHETGRTYTPGSWGCFAFLLAIIAFFILVGIFIFIYMLLVKPAGVLVVTYTRTVPPVVEPVPVTETARPAVEEELQQDGPGTGS